MIRRSTLTKELQEFKQKLNTRISWLIKGHIVGERQIWLGLGLRNKGRIIVRD